MKKVTEKSLLWFDNVIKFNVKTPYDFLVAYGVNLNFNNRRLKESQTIVAPWIFISTNLIGAFLSPTYIKHACSTFKTRKHDIHGVVSPINIDRARAFLSFFVLRNLKIMLEEQHNIFVGADTTSQQLSFGFKDTRKFKNFKRTFLRYTNLRLGGVMSFVFMPRHAEAAHTKASFLTYYSYFLKQFEVVGKDD